MHQIIKIVRQLRNIAVFKISTRMVVITLMLSGVWVATRQLEFPPGFSINDKLIHIVVFFGFSVLVDLSSSRKPFWLWKGLPLVGYGVLIEVFQYFTLMRSFSILDMVADFAGVAIYFSLKVAVLFVFTKKQN